MTFGQAQCLENPDAVKKWGDVSDWHHAIGTGPFILKDFVPENSATIIKNPDYWGHDERYPQNKLPYVDKIKYLIIPDDVIALEAMRAGKIDVMDIVSPKQAKVMKKTNPEILQMPIPEPAPTVHPRNDKPPFNDIRVRKAMQMAIDLPALAKDYYHGIVEPYPTHDNLNDMKGWGFPYEEWPQDLRDEYAYNPAGAKQLLADAGYPNGFKTNVVADTAADIDLLQIVKSYFAQVGIDMEIRMMETNVCRDFVTIGHKHDQLVYRTYAPITHSAEPMSQIRRYQTGLSGNYLMVSDPVTDAFYPKALVAESVNDNDTIKKVLRDANERALRQHFTIALLNRCRTPCVSHGLRATTLRSIRHGWDLEALVWGASIWGDSG